MEAVKGAVAVVLVLGVEEVAVGVGCAKSVRPWARRIAGRLPRVAGAV